MTPERVLAAIDGTWPPARIFDDGPWTLRDGQGGGQRVSAATLRDGTRRPVREVPSRRPFTADELATAETAMQAMGQPPLFMIRPGEEDLDAQLDARGYVVHDPVRAWVCPPAQLCDKPLPRITVFDIWEPLVIMREIWAEGGIGPGRIAVMERAKGPKTALFGRLNQRPAGVAYVAIHDGVAMLHALEIVPEQRRQGLADWMMRGAAFWARDHGADTLAVLCTRANTAANSLYASLSMTPVTDYHYRRKPEGAPS
ncbi:MAG: GNAT family N-acetyltransferase [Marinibacterium profundimaris]